jgi:HK97 family phage portal protein
MNRVQKFFNRFGNKANKSHTVRLTSNDTSRFKLFNGLFSFSFANDGKAFNKYIEAFRSNPLVFTIITNISRNESSLPRIYVDANGNEVTNSKMQEVLQSPNANQFEIDFRQELDETLLSTGNAFIRSIGIVGNNVAELTVLPTDKVDIVINSINEVIYYVYNQNDKAKVRIELEDMLHIKTTNIVHTNDEAAFYGFSPLEAAFNLVVSSNEIFEAEAAIFKNKGIVGLLTNETEVPILNKERQRLQTEFNEEIGGADRFNQVHITSSKLKYIQMGMSPTDLKLLEGIINKLRLLCSVYGLNSVLFNDQANSKFDNMAEASRMAMINSYLPLGKKIDRSLSRFLNQKLGTQEFIKIDEKKIDVLKVINTDLSEQILAQFEAGLIDQAQAQDALGWNDTE